MPTFKLPLIPAPPTTTSVPEEVPELYVLPLIDILPDVILPVTPKVVPIVTLLLTVNALAVKFELEFKLVK